MKGLRNAFLCCLLFWAVIIYGCAGIGKFTPKGAQIANNAVTVAQGLLHVLDGFYGDLVALKALPDHTTEATRALSIADASAAFLRQIIDGLTVSEEQLNIAAGQVDGAKAVLNQIVKRSGEIK